MNAPLSHSGLFVGGEWIPARDSLDVLNPADGSRVGRCALGSEAELELAVNAARKAFATTRSLPGYERSAVLTRIAAGIEQRRDLFASLIVAEAGKPITFAEAEVNRAIHTFTAAAAESRETMGELLSMDAFNPGQGHSGLVRRFPIGVIYGMTPFNFPLNLVAHKVAPALASGNCIIVKPSPRTPLTALLLAEVIESAGATRGQVNVIVCSNEHAARLVGDPGVAMTSFTGSPAIGWALKARCGRQKLTLELGGNAAVVVHEDADLEAAVPLIATGAFGYAGQSCISVQRILVHEPVRERFQELLLSWTTSRVKMGDPTDRECMVGPMI
ncbi:MAG: aldehyde dehydrogenase family protein, partial [Verrucomicrobia bacterium]|nr:aldehyde dehydrogenase family protein [Verrucomicrobiota bacterium]